MKSPKILYILTAVFCVFALAAGIYEQFIGRRSENTTNTPITEENIVVAEKDRETIKSEFNNLFTNTLNLNGFDTTNIIKLRTDSDIVFGLDRTESTDAYEIDIHVPVVNIKGDIPSSFNKVTQAIFANKANEILRKTDTTTKTLYDVDYVAYVNEGILSVVIKSTLKEGQSAQRVMVQTYNYDLSTGMEMKLNDIITRRAFNKDEVNGKIRAVVREADNESKAIANAGYNEVFSRDLNSDMYEVDNSSIFFLNHQNELYIVYAYGNQNFTSEMDIVVF